MEAKLSENISHPAAAVSDMDFTSGCTVKRTAEMNPQNVIFLVTCIEFFSRFFITVATDLFLGTQTLALVWKHLALELGRFQGLVSWKRSGCVCSSRQLGF